MAHLQWTTIRPTIPGWYWARGLFRYTVNEDEWDEVIQIIRIIEADKDTAYPCGDEVGDRIEAYTHFIGPLYIPSSPMRDKT